MDEIVSDDSFEDFEPDKNPEAKKDSLSKQEKKGKPDSANCSSSLESLADGSEEGKGNMDIDEGNHSEECNEETLEKMQVLMDAASNAQQYDLKNVENDSFSNSSDDDNESDDNGSDVIEKPHMPVKSSENSEKGIEEKDPKAPQENPKILATPNERNAGSKTIVTRNLSYSVERADLENLFKECGEIVDVRLHTDAEGRFRGFGHVEFATAEAAQNALQLNNTELLRCRIRVVIAPQKNKHRSYNENFLAGDKVKSWEDRWICRDQSLAEKYPRLYLISSQQQQLIGQVGEHINSSWEWRFIWRRPLFDSEVDLAITFLSEVDGQVILTHGAVRWVWVADQSGIYSTQSAYEVLREGVAEENLEDCFRVLWKIRIPSKIAIFVWRLLRDRLPTKSNLQARQVQIPDLNCPFCGRMEEDASHLFIHCSKIQPLWWDSMSWINLKGALPLSPKQLFMQYSFLQEDGRRNRRWQYWWLAITWTTWQLRNRILFSGATFDGNKLVEDATFLMWTWLHNLEKDFTIHFNHCCVLHHRSVESMEAVRFKKFCKGRIQAVRIWFSDCCLGFEVWEFGETKSKRVGFGLVGREWEGFGFHVISSNSSHSFQRSEGTQPVKGSEISGDCEQETEPKLIATCKEPSATSKAIYAKNLAYSMEQDDMEYLFKNCGEIVSIHLHTDHNGRFKGYGHVEFATTEAAQKSIGGHQVVVLVRIGASLLHGCGVHTPHGAAAVATLRLGLPRHTLLELLPHLNMLLVVLNTISPFKLLPDLNELGHFSSLRSDSSAKSNVGMSLIPSPSFSFGRHTVSHLIQAILFWSSPPPHRNLLCKRTSLSTTFLGTLVPCLTLSWICSNRNTKVHKRNGQQTTVEALELNNTVYLGRRVGVFIAKGKGEYTSNRSNWSKSFHQSEQTKPIKSTESSEYCEEEVEGKASNSSWESSKRVATLKEQNAPSKTIYVKNLSYRVERADMENLFKECGKIVDVHLHRNPDGRLNGFGQVEFATAEAAKKALELHNTELLRRPIGVDLAEEKGEYTYSRSNWSNSFQKCERDQSPTVFVTGFDSSLPAEKIKASLEEHFGSCGEIQRISIPTFHDSGAVKGFAHLGFKDVVSVRKALHLDQNELGGFHLRVEKAKPRRENQGIGGGRGGGGGHQFGGRDGSGYTSRMGWGRSGGGGWHSLHFSDEGTDKGGLGIKDLKTFNTALLGKWRWDLFQQQGELWARILDSKYGGWRSLAEGIRGSNESPWWKDLMMVLHQQQRSTVLKNEIAWREGCGDKIRFWEDCWTGADGRQHRQQSNHIEQILGFGNLIQVDNTQQKGGRPTLTHDNYCSRCCNFFGGLIAEFWDLCNSVNWIAFVATWSLQ
ncbi:Nucleolin 2 isoform G [Glycine soja]|nr:Nucleolin 2 isoform G [Glycine soja]